MFSHRDEGRVLLVELRYGRGERAQRIHLVAAHLPSHVNASSEEVDETTRLIGSVLADSGRRTMKILGVDANVRLQVDMADGSVVGRGIENRELQHSRHVCRQIVFDFRAEVQGLDMTILNSLRDFWAEEKLWDFDRRELFRGGDTWQGQISGTRTSNALDHVALGNDSKQSHNIPRQRDRALRLRPPGPRSRTRLEPLPCGPLLNMMCVPENRSDGVPTTPSAFVASRLDGRTWVPISDISRSRELAPKAAVRNDTTARHRLLRPETGCEEFCGISHPRS